MKTDYFRGSLYDDILESLSDVRRQAMDNMRKIRERSGASKGKKNARETIKKRTFYQVKERGLSF